MFDESAILLTWIDHLIHHFRDCNEFLIFVWETNNLQAYRLRSKELRVIYKRLGVSER